MQPKMKLFFPVRKSNEATGTSFITAKMNIGSISFANKALLKIVDRHVEVVVRVQAPQFRNQSHRILLEYQALIVSLGQ